MIFHLWPVTWTSDRTLTKHGPAEGLFKSPWFIPPVLGVPHSGATHTLFL